MRKIISLLAAAAALTVATPAAAAVTLQTGGTVTGATGVAVNGMLYDVEFRDGTCGAVFGGCDQPSDFTFNTQAAGDAAVAALISQVLNGINGPIRGLVGCDSTCQILLPTSRDSAEYVSGSGAINYGGAVGLPVGWQAATFGLVASYDLAGSNYLTFAKFTATGVAAPAAVPEPATWALMLLGFGGIGFAMRKQRKPVLQIA